MNLLELIDTYRSLSRDNAQPYFVSDALATILANEAQNEACRRGDLLIDSASSMCSISVSAGDPLIKLHSSILDVRRAKLANGTAHLLPIKTADLDAFAANWESESGIPSHYVIDYQSGYIRLYPSPSADDDLQITVRRLPAESMADDADEPEIRQEAHLALVHWMMFRAYSTSDSDMYDPIKATNALREFEREFGAKRSVRNEMWSRTTHNAVDPCPIA